MKPLRNFSIVIFLSTDLRFNRTFATMEDADQEWLDTVGDFKHGSIKRIKLTRFLTYSAVEFSPGPRCVIYALSITTFSFKNRILFFVPVFSFSTSDLSSHFRCLSFPINA